ncbi:MAG: hypothetical protein RIQ51_1826, partial [Bacteroidota bacterium]
WQTTFGWIAVEETQWRLGRRGPVLRPFCTRAGVKARGTSRRLQRVLVDFGAEASFARAVVRVREHYGMDVALGRLRRHTLAHCRTRRLPTRSVRKRRDELCLAQTTRPLLNTCASPPHCGEGGFVVLSKFSRIRPHNRANPGIIKTCIMRNFI